METGADDFAVIRRPYLAVLNTPYFVDGEGRVFLDRSWHRDLVQHLDYLAAFTLAAPMRPLPADAATLEPLAEKDRARLKLIALPPHRSRRRAIVELPNAIRTIWSAVGEAEIVHVGMAGWPYPLGWLASAIAIMRRRKLLIIVESTWWRISDKAGTKASFLRRLEAGIYERLAQFWCTKADLSFYTQPSYLKKFHPDGKGPAYVAPASWVNAADILDDAQARQLWDSKAQEAARFLFAGRLTSEKGVKVLLDAAQKLAATGAHGVLHIIGDGPLLGDVVAAEQNGNFAIKYFEPVPYGLPFLTFLQQYHVVVVPSLSYEQPRIVFDAAARAVPVLASDTDGLRPYVQDDRTGYLVAPGDSNALARAMASLIEQPQTLRRLALGSLSFVRGKTHRAMHIERSQLIAQHLGTR